jgi:hypothetical protein
MNPRRILARIEPSTGESPYGYLLRVAEVYQYHSRRWLLDLAKLEKTDDLHRREYAAAIAECLRLRDDEWSYLSYQVTGGSDRFHQRLFRGQVVAAGHLNVKSPRICPVCVKDAMFCRAEWDIGLISACPLHGCLLVNTCWKCHQRLRWSRKGVGRYKCEADLCSSPLIPAEPNLVAVNACLHFSAGLRVQTISEILRRAGLSSEFQHLDLDALLRVFFLLETLAQKTPDSIRKFSATDMSPALEIGCSAGAAASDWPNGLLHLFRTLVSRAENQGDKRVRNLTGRHHYAWLKLLNDSRLSFIREVYESFLAQESHARVRRLIFYPLNNPLKLTLVSVHVNRFIDAFVIAECDSPGWERSNPSRNAFSFLDLVGECRPLNRYNSGFLIVGEDDGFVDDNGSAEQCAFAGHERRRNICSVAPGPDQLVHVVNTRICPTLGSGSYPGRRRTPATWRLSSSTGVLRRLAEKCRACFQAQTAHTTTY